MATFPYMASTLAVRMCFVVVCIVLGAMLFEGMVSEPTDDVGTGCWHTNGPCRYALGGVVRMIGAYFACSMHGGFMNVLVLSTIQAFTDATSETLSSWAAYSVGAFLYWSSDRLSTPPAPVADAAPAQTPLPVTGPAEAITTRPSKRGKRTAGKVRS